MFDILVESNPEIRSKKTLFSLIISILLHSIILMVAIITPLFFTDTLNPTATRDVPGGASTPASPSTPATRDDHQSHESAKGSAPDTRQNDDPGQHSPGSHSDRGRGTSS